ATLWRDGCVPFCPNCPNCRTCVRCVHLFPKESHEVRSGRCQDRVSPGAFPPLTRGLGGDRRSSADHGGGRLPGGRHRGQFVGAHPVINHRGRPARGG